MQRPPRNTGVRRSLYSESTANGGTFAVLNGVQLGGSTNLSGGYSREEANDRLSRNNGMVASFSRALSEGLTAQQSDDEFNAMLDTSIESIYQASIT